MNILPIPKPLPSIPLYNDINKNNIIELQLIINYIIDSSSLISLDTEFTGLGKISDGIRASNLEERYKALKNVVSKYALVAFGLSLFQNSGKSKDDPNCILYQNHSFNFLMLPQHDYMQSSKSMKFLIENGFDFNNQALKGIPYFPGENKRMNDNNPLTEYNVVMRRIFNRILKRARKVPVVVHNGLMDLMFLYHSFFAPLPDKLDTFLVDLAKMFPNGIYDTKYIADYVIRETSSFLSYLFRKEERMQLYNKNIKKGKYIKCLIKKRIHCIEQLKKEKPRMKRPLDTGKIYCEQYAAHGFCIFGKECTKTHNLDVILDEQMKEKLKPSKRKRRKERKKMRQLEEDNQQSSTTSKDPETTQETISSEINESKTVNQSESDTVDQSVSDIVGQSESNIVSQSESNIVNSTTEQRCLQAILEKNYSEAYDLFMKNFKDNNYLLNTTLSRNVYQKLHERNLIDDYVVEEDGNVSSKSKNDLMSIEKEKLFDIFKDIDQSENNISNQIKDDEVKEIGNEVNSTNNNNVEEEEKENNSNKINSNQEDTSLNIKETKKESDKLTQNENDETDNENESAIVESLIIFENQEVQNTSNSQNNDTHIKNNNNNTINNNNTDSDYSNNETNVNQITVKNFETYHSAYFDAFMTGYVFCCQCIECEEKILNSDHANKLYVIGKSIPLLIRSSPYTKNSEHCKKILETI